MDETQQQQEPTDRRVRFSPPDDDGVARRRGRDSLTPTSFSESSEDEQFGPTQASSSRRSCSRSSKLLGKRSKGDDDDDVLEDDQGATARDGRVGAALCRWWKRPKCHRIGDAHSLSEEDGPPPSDGANDHEPADRPAAASKETSNNWSQAQSDFLRLIPHDVVGHCLSFVSSSTDRTALVLTCRQFGELADRDVMLRAVDLAGEATSGRRCFLSDVDTRETAVRRLARFVAAGNPESIHMMGLIRCYCYEDVPGGIDLLRRSAHLGHVQSAYSLGIILRDCRRDESDKMMDVAARARFLPAMQEKNASREIRDVHGVLTAEELRNYLDPVGLGRLLSKYYIDSSHGRSVPSSHCWNPLCGKWAYKSIRSASDGEDTEEESNEDGALVDRLLAGGGGRSSSSSGEDAELRVSRMKMCSSCRRAKYCSKLCQVFDWRSGRHKSECHFL